MCKLSLCATRAAALKWNRIKKSPRGLVNRGDQLWSGRLFRGDYFGRIHQNSHHLFEMCVFLKQLLLHVLEKSISLALKPCKLQFSPCTNWEKEDIGQDSAESHKLQRAEHSLFAGQIGWTDWNDNKPRSSQDSRKKKKLQFWGRLEMVKKKSFSNFIMLQGETFAPFLEWSNEKVSCYKRNQWWLMFFLHSFFKLLIRVNRLIYLFTLTKGGTNPKPRTNSVVIIIINQRTLFFLTRFSDIFSEKSHTSERHLNS